MIISANFVYFATISCLIFTDKIDYTISLKICKFFIKFYFHYDELF